MGKDKTPLILTGFTDIFSTSTFDGERVIEVALTELYAPDPHPFVVRDDEAMSKLAESIREHGIREPGLARPRQGGGYELLCGNRRKRACEIAGITKMPILLRELDDRQAVLAMVDSNLQQRESILPSEKAWAYRYRMEALNHNGIKAEQHSGDIMAEQTGESAAQIFRFIRLTELVETLLDKVDAKKISFSAAVELSHLTYEEQHLVVDCMAKNEVKPSLSQAVRLKEISKANELTAEMIDEILAEAKKPPKGEPTGSARYRRFFPATYSSKQINEVITGLLRDWQKQQKTEARCE